MAETTDSQAQARIAELEAELTKYVGKEPTIADEMAYLRRCLNAVRELCGEARLGSCLGITIEAVEQALNGERDPSPDDKRRRIYIDGNGNGWLDQSTGHNGLRWIAPLAIFPGDAQPAPKVAERTGGLHEIGRCW